MQISLNWSRSSNGYDISPKQLLAPPVAGVAPKIFKAPKNTIAAGSGNRGSWVTPNGDHWRWYDCMTIDGLYHLLAKMPHTEDGVRAFADRYGLLNAGPEQLVSDFYHQSKVMQSLIAMKEAGYWEALQIWMIDNRKAIRFHPEFRGGKRPQLFFRPAALADAIYIKFFEDISGGANLRLCKLPGCGAYFRYGPGTNPPRRNTAEYCRPRCQKSHYDAKMKEPKS